MPPALSFIVPVRNDASRLAKCLQSIRRTAGTLAVEVVVADNASTDGSADVAGAAGARVLFLPDARVAHLRNAGASASTAPLLAFIDADHELNAGWARAALEILENPDVTAVGAPYRAPPDGTWVQRMYDRFRRHEPGCRTVDWLPSGNLVVRRAAFEAVGGFDATLEACEDVDLCQRLRQKGGRLVSADALRSVHLGDPPTLKALFLGELWRGRDNLKVSLRMPLTLQSLPSVAIPIVNLLALGAVALGAALWRQGGAALVGLGTMTFVILTGLRAMALLTAKREARLDGRTAGQAVIVAAVYETARALALVSRSGHALRRRT